MSSLSHQPPVVLPLSSSLHDEELGFITQLSYELNNPSNHDPIKDIALPMIQQYTLASYAHFALFDARKKTLSLYHIQAENALINAIGAVAGNNFFSTPIPVTDKDFELIVNSDIAMLTSIVDMSFGAFSPVLDKMIKKLTGFSYFCSIPQMDQGKLFGITVLAFDKHQKWPSRTLLKSYSSVLSLALRKKSLTEKIEREQIKFNKLFYVNPTLMAINLAKEKTFIEVNDAFLHALAYKREEVIGKTSAELNLFVDINKQQQMAEKLKKTGNVRNIELSVRAKNGKVLQGLFSGEVFFQDETPYFLTVMVDITENRRLDQLRKQLIEKLSHELRTPLSAIKQAFHIYSEGNHDEEDYFKNTIQRNIQRLESLLAKIMDYQILSKEDISLLRVKTYPNELLVKIQDKARQVYPELKIHIEADHAQDPVYLDHSWIILMFEELVNNAVIHGDATELIFKFRSSLDQNLFIFIDNGRGIPEEDLPNVFDPFFQSKQEYQTKRGKAGLGLSVARKIVEAHGGRISVESPASKGTIVNITLPRLICHS